MGDKPGIPRFMIDKQIMFCSPVTVYKAKKDGSFTARCHSVPGGMAVEGKTFDETVALATDAYMKHCRTGIWN